MSAFTTELESEDDLKGLMEVLDGAGVLNGIERPVPVKAVVTIYTESGSSRVEA